METCDKIREINRIIKNITDMTSHFSQSTISEYIELVLGVTHDNKSWYSYTPLEICIGYGCSTSIYIEIEPYIGSPRMKYTSWIRFKIFRSIFYEELLSDIISELYNSYLSDFIDRYIDICIKYARQAYNNYMLLDTIIIKHYAYSNSIDIYYHIGNTSYTAVYNLSRCTIIYPGNSGLTKIHGIDTLINNIINDSMNLIYMYIDKIATALLFPQIILQ